MLASLRLTLAVLAVGLLVAARSQVRTTGVLCTNYDATSSSPPGSVNWTDTSGFWVPGGSYPGAGTCDTATNPNSQPTYILVNTFIDNPLAGINFSCPGCVIDIQAGGTLTIGGGSGTGTGFITNGTSIRVNGGTLIVNTTDANGGVTFDGGGQLELNSGTVSGTGVINIGSTGGMTQGSSSNVTIDGVTINSSGSVFFFPSAPTNLSLNNGASISSSGTMIVSDVASILTSGGGTINNSGNFIKTGGVPTTIDAVFNNVAGASGVDIQAQALKLAGGGQGDAPFVINCGECGLEFPSGTYTMGAGGGVSGGGTLSVTGGTLTIGGVTEPTNFMMSAGTLDGPGFLTVSGFFDWSGGTIAGSGGTELAGGGMGYFTPATPMALDDRTFNIYGTVDYSGATSPVDLANNAVLAIYGTFNIVDDGSITDSSGGLSQILVSPNGIFAKTGGTGTSTIEPALNNDSELYVDSGTLDLAGGGLHQGFFYAASGATLRISQTAAFDGPSIINADGTIDFAGGMIALAGTHSIAGQTLISGGNVGVFTNGSTVGFTMTSGDLYMIDSTYTMTGTGTWSEGSIGGDGGTFIVSSGATLTIDSATCVPVLYDMELVNNGTINYTQTQANPANYFEMSGATLTNNGTFDMQGDAPITEDSGLVAEAAAVGADGGCSRAARHRAATHRVERPRASLFVVTPSAIVNFGTWKKTGTGTSDIQPAFTNSGNLLAENGEMNFTTSLTQTGGVTTLGPGNIASTNTAFVISGGTLNGAGTITGTLQNDAGSIAPGIGLTTGVIGVTNDYSQGATATLDVGIAGPAAGQFDQVNVANTATLDGTFTATLLSGYIPANGTSWPVLTYTTNSGLFATENLPTFPPTGTVTSSYTGTAYVLTANVAALSVDLSAGMTGPATVNAAQTLSYDVTITNNGPNNHSGTITVVNTLPAGATAAVGSNTGGWSCGAPSGGTITCTNSTALNNTQSLPVLTFTMTAPVSGGGVTNSATVSSATGDPNGTNNTAFVNTTVVAQTDLQVTKTGPGGVTAGQNVTYTVVVRNNGPSTATGVTVTDPDPANLTFVSNSGACTTPYPCGLGTLTSGQSVTITSTYSTSPSFSGNVTNTATVSGNEGDPNNTNNSSSATTNVGAQADLSITKTGPASTTTGQNITYTITYINNGPSPATSTVINDPTPVGIAFLSNTGSCSTPYPCSVGTLAAGQSGTITSTYTVPANYSATSISNTASISSAVNDPATGNNSSTAVTNVSQTADVGIVKTGPASASPGQNIVYTVTVSNAGPAAAGSVVASDTTPTGLTFVSNSGACTTAYPCNIGILTSGQSVSITSTYSIPVGHTGASISNTATVTSGATDSNGVNNTSTVVTPLNTQADVSVSKTGPGLATPGQNIVYTVTVSNAGPAAAGSVVVTDPTPPGLTFVSNTGACTTAYPCSLGTLTSGQSQTITTTYAIPANYASPSIVNTASVTAGAPDANTANNSSTVTTSILASADLSITKSGPASFSQGQNIVYTITVTNAGPLSAANTFVSDPTPPGLTFVSNSGACTGPFPCALGTLTVGQTATITSTFNVPSNYAGTTVTNTADVSTSTTEVNTNNNSSSTTATVTASAADVSITKTGPGGARDFDVIAFTIVVRNNGPSSASNIVVTDPQPVGMVWISNSGACTTPFPCNLGTLAPTATATITSTYRVSGGGDAITNTATVTSTPTDANTANNSSSAVVTIGRGFTCPTRGPALTSPGPAAIVTSPVALSWTSVANSIGYIVTILKTGEPPIILNTGTTSISVPLNPGAYAWFVSAAGGESCGPLASGTSSFIICTGLLGAPVPSVVGESTTGQTYNVAWNAIQGATTYELQESTNAAFTNPTVFAISTNGRSFTKTATSPTAYFYRARAIAACSPTPGPFGPSVSVVVVPVPVPTNYDPNVNVPDGSTTPVTWQIFIPGLPEGTTSFIASVDRPWLTVAPTSGILPPEGLTFTISADPTALTNGTWTGTIVIVYGTTVISQRVGTDGTTTKTVPVSISLVTPVTPTPLSAATNSAMVVPSVGHLSGVGSLWRSDIRLANLASGPQKFSLTFNDGSGNPAALMKQTTISVDAGATAALDDIVRNWYGVGSLGTSSNGLLTVQPLDAAGKPLQGIGNVSAVSTRTFNAASTGTLGQFIPAVPFTKFIGSGANAAVLSLQQIAQTDAFRTNLGVVEAGGKAAAVLVSAFDGDGAKLFEVPLTLQAGEQRLLNSFLAANGVTSLENGRIEVRVTGGDGKVTAYASVVDNKSNDPMLISGSVLGGIGSSRFVIPGIADLTGGGANWRSDVRVFNGGAAPQSATLTFYPSGNGASISKQVPVAPGQIQQLDDVLHSILGVTNAGGALHVTTNIDAPLIVTARTYDQTSAGTLGQFIPAVTTTDAVGRLDRALQILQAEESSRYRTNVGIAEVTGQAATAEITVFLPNSKITPVLQVPLAAFESRQIGILSSLGLNNSYNVRVSVRIIDGDGKVTAYGSVIDNSTKDPTFIPAQ